MDKLTEQLGHAPRRIAVLRAIKLGDLLCAVPALRALRRAFPDAHIALISLPWAAEFVARYPHYVDEFIRFPGWPGLPEQPLDPAGSVAFLAEMQARGWDVVVQMQGNGTLVNAMLALFGATVVAGYHPTQHPERFAPHPALFAPYPAAEHEVKRWTGLLNTLGIPTSNLDLEFPVTDADRDRATQLLTTSGAPLPGGPVRAGHYVCVHAGGISGRRWPEARFAAVADALAERGYGVVLTGMAAEAPIVEAVQQHMRHPALNVVGQTDLGTLAAVLQGAALLVSNDTGVSHLAAACAVPSVVVFTSANPAEWAPLNRHRHRVVPENATTADVLTEAGDVLAQRAPVGT